MRQIREITAEQENFRIVAMGGQNVIRRDGVEPEPVGTIVLLPFRIVGYDRDCDGSLMARLEQCSIGKHDDLDDDVDPEIRDAPLAQARHYGGVITHWGLYPSSGFVASPEEIRALIPVATVP